MTALEIKPLPVDLSFKALFDPNDSYAYFRNAASQSFPC